MEAPATVLAVSLCTSSLAFCAVVTGGAAPTYLGIGAAVTGSIDGGGVGCGITQMCIYMRRIYLYSYVCVCIRVLDCVSKINHGLHRWWDQRLRIHRNVHIHVKHPPPALYISMCVCIRVHECMDKLDDTQNWHTAPKIRQNTPTYTNPTLSTIIRVHECMHKWDDGLHWCRGSSLRDCTILLWV